MQKILILVLELLETMFHNSTKSEFVEKYEKPRIPVVLTHTMDHWKSMRKWTVEV